MRDLDLLLETIVTITEDDTASWVDRAAAIKSRASELGERYETALEEFLSWWLPDEE